MSKFLSVIVFVLFSIQLQAQVYGNNKLKKLVRYDGELKMSGWLFAPGLTYSVPNQTKDYVMSVGEDTTFEGSFNPSGKIGLYLEGGRYHIIPHGVLFNYIDYGIAYKSIRGKEVTEGRIMNVTDTLVIDKDNGGLQSFGDHHISAFFHANNIFQLTNTTFLQNSIGVQVDFPFLRNRNRMEYKQLDSLNRFPSSPKIQLTYKIGYGFKPNNRIAIIPSLEFPIMSLHAFDGGNPTLQFFKTRYWPVTFSVRIVLLRNKKRICPPVYSPKTNEKRQLDYLESL